ncbi:MAG TPA: methyltransferase domain-containing protein [Phaeodactylibacter sp.]|nr:methyltransferase domain-containing protein [Phaeodactylibacter sp.]
MSKAHFKVGGVPEHFNYPWYYAAERDMSLARSDVSFSWRSFPGGTGAMCEALRKGEVDVAIMLTEGAVADIVKGNPSRIIGTYVNSPLVWGVHVSANSPFHSVEELEGQKIAISRYQSGSHLMAFVHAQQQGWNTRELDFELVGGLEGAREALAEDRAQVFLWEKFTTKPIVDRGEFRRVGECLTPWPCFVLVARQEVCENRQADLLELLYGIRQLMETIEPSQKIDYISQRFEQQRADVEEWFGQTEWYCAPTISSAELDKVQDTLEALSILDTRKAVRDLCAPFCVFAEQGLSGSMYNWRVNSVYKALEQQGKAEGPLGLKDLLALGHLDQYHYLGAEACYELADALSLDEQHYVYDIGSGVGGTARVLADCSGCQVLGVELQPELCRLSTELTRRVGLAGRVDFKAGNFLDYEWDEVFDDFVSLLVFLHLPERSTVLDHCYRALKPDGQFFIEDFVALNPFSAEEKSQLRDRVSAVQVSSAAQYQQDLEAAGFIDVELQDMSDAWRVWTQQRHDSFQAEASKHRALFGDQLYEKRLSFYKVIADLFAGSNLGGVRITGRKPA